MLIVYLHTKFHTPISNISLDIAARPTAKNVSRPSFVRPPWSFTF